MRVLQVMAGAAHGGAEAFFTRLVTGLGRAGLNQRAVIRGDTRRTTMLRDSGIDVAEESFGGLFDWRTQKRLRQHIETYDPDLVLTWMNRATRHCPRIEPAKRRFVHAARLGGYYNLKYYERCDHLIANTEDIGAYIKGEGWPSSRVHVLANFVSPGTLPSLERSTQATPNQAPLVLALGRFHRNKAFDVLIDAIAKLPDAYLWLAGEGPLRRSLENLAAGKGIGDRIRFLGWHDDVSALFAGADVMVCPSRVEPFGNVVVEAWAHNVPVIATRATGPAALIKDGSDGLLVPCEDSTALAAAIRRVTEDADLAASLARAGYARFQQDFAENVVIEKYLELFDYLVRDRNETDPMRPRQRSP